MVKLGKTNFNYEIGTQELAMNPSEPVAELPFGDQGSLNQFGIHDSETSIFNNGVHYYSTPKPIIKSLGFEDLRIAMTELIPLGEAKAVEYSKEHEAKIDIYHSQV